jgi:hypothetical protein
MKAKAFTSALLMLALLAASTGVARAGSGGSGGGTNPLDFVFLTDCYSVDDGGDNPPYTMELTDPYGVRQNIKVGQAMFLCVSSGAWSRQPNSGSPALNPQFDPTLINASKCYHAVSPGDHGPGPVGVVTDLFSTKTTTSLKKLTILCSPANVPSASGGQ